MKIVIISDIHDNLVNLEKCLSWCKKEEVEKIICCGDVTNSDILKFLSENFSGEIFLVKGNAELYDEAELEIYKNINYGGRLAGHSLGDGRTAVFEIAGFKVGVCHEPFLIKEVLAKMENPPRPSSTPPKEGNLKIVFFGHTHKPWIEEKEGIKTVNPGTLGGVFTPATFAYWETENGALELKLLQNI